MFRKKVKPSSVVIKISIHTNLHRKVVEKESHIQINHLRSKNPIMYS